MAPIKNPTPLANAIVFIISPAYKKANLSHQRLKGMPMH